jgi:hypothetical protein
MSLSEDVLIEILKKLSVTDLIKFNQVNIYYNQLIIKNKILVHNLINEYKNEEEDELVDILITSQGDDYIMTLLEAFITIYPCIVNNGTLVSVILDSLSLPILKYLLDNGLNPNLSIFGYTLLELLIRHYDESLAEEYNLVFELLFQYGADPNININYEKTILDEASNYSFYQLFLKYS